MKLHSELASCLEEQQRQQQLLLKTMRYEKAVAEFSKQKFMKKHLAPNSAIENINITNSNPYQSQLLKGERQKVENLKINLITVLKNKNVDFEDRTTNISQFPLSYFDEEAFQSVNNLNYLINTRFQSGAELSCRCLLKYRSKYTYVYGKVYGYDHQKQKFYFKYEDNSKEIKVLAPRISLCFDDQNPYRHCSRVAKAFSSRISFASHHKFIQAVKKMPTSYISKFNQTQKNKIDTCVNKKRIFQKLNVDLLFQEVEGDFKLVMNSLMLRRCSNLKKDSLIPHQFSVKYNQFKEVSYYGLPEKLKNQKEIVVTKDHVTITEAKPLLQKFHIFCQQSLLTSKQVVLSLQSIKSQCDEIIGLQLFKVEMIKIFNTKEAKQPFRFEHFQADQNVYNQKILSKIKTLWVGNIRSVVERQFRKGAVGWFNMNEKDRQIYTKSKTRRYFQRLRLMMENTLLQLCKESFKNYVLYVQRFIPERVEIISPRHVISHYSDGYVMDSTIPQTYQRIKSKLTLFQTDLMKNYDESGFSLATPAHNFMNLILNNFDKMLDELAKIPDIESKCMIQLYKKNKGDRFLKVPNRFATDEDNKWIAESFSSLKSSLEAAIQPVLRYIAQFDQFTSVLKMRPQQYVKQIQRQDEENQKDIHWLKQQVLSLYRKEKELTEQMPSCIRVSIFKIHLKEINQKLAAKYNSTAKGLELLIAKKARKACKNVLEKYDQIKLKIKVKPKDIEKLVELKECINNISTQLSSIHKQVAQTNAIYDVLDELRYVMPQEDLKKKYQMLLGPKQIKQDAEKRKEQLASKNLEFSDNLRIQQQQFKLTLEGRARTVAQFGMHSKKQQYKEIVQKVEIILDSLNKCQGEAKRINNRQQLFDKNITDYSKVNEIQNEFMNYANYWLTLNEWNDKYSNKLLDATIGSINIADIKSFVEEAIKKLRTSIAFFTSKDLTVLAHNSDMLREELQSLSSVLPVVQGLKEMGNSQKNWSELSEKIQVKVSNHTLTINKIKELNLEKHIQLIKEMKSKALKEHQDDQAPIKTRAKQVSKLSEQPK